MQFSCQILGFKLANTYRSISGHLDYVSNMKVMPFYGNDKSSAQRRGRGRGKKLEEVRRLEEEEKRNRVIGIVTIKFKNLPDCHILFKILFMHHSFFNVRGLWILMRQTSF
ncbi:unnamed protein product [Urochloa humidicola]